LDADGSQRHQYDEYLLLIGGFIARGRCVWC
ncbi:hypothetical protein R3I94_023286, partial [Phoxinus phoxinus]